MKIQKATKEKLNALIAFVGPSGSGKTYSALAVATELLSGNGRILVIDTENHSASLYADVFEFDTIILDPPFHPRRFVEALQMARDAGGYEAVIIDSLSHSWMGKGGSLNLVDQEVMNSQSGRGNSHFAWRKVTPINRDLFEEIRIARNDFHLIATMRAKTSYAYEKETKNGHEKIIPVKIGMGPEIRSGSEYTFDVIFDMDMGNNAQIDKSRCSALRGRTFHKPGVEVADILFEWLDSGATVEKVAEAKREHLAEAQFESLQTYDAMGRAIALSTWAEITYDLPESKQYFTNAGGIKMFRDHFEKGEFDLVHNPIMLIVLTDYVTGLKGGLSKVDALASAQNSWDYEIALLAMDEEE